MKTTTDSFFVGDMDIIAVSPVSRSRKTSRVINQAEIVFDKNGKECLLQGNRMIYKLLCILQHSEWVPKYFNEWKKNIQTMDYREFVHYICDILKQIPESAHPVHSAILDRMCLLTALILIVSIMNQE